MSSKQINLLVNFNRNANNTALISCCQLSHVLRATWTNGWKEMDINKYQMLSRQRMQSENLPLLQLSKCNMLNFWCSKSNDWTLIQDDCVNQCSYGCSMMHHELVMNEWHVINEKNLICTSIINQLHCCSMHDLHLKHLQQLNVIQQRLHVGSSDWGIIIR
jgi:hypothetical protein